jgi:hypothetical protein
MHASTRDTDDDHDRSKGLPCRVYLTPVYEETLRSNNVISDTSSLTSNTDTSLAESTVSPTALASSTKHERSRLLSVGLKAPPRVGLQNALDSNASVDSLFLRPEELDLTSQESHLFIERVKIFGDGSLGAETAAISLVDDVDSNKGDDEVVVESSSKCNSANSTSEMVTSPLEGKSFKTSDRDATRTVKISFPVEMEIDYCFQDSLHQYMQLYGPVSHIGFHAFGSGSDACSLAEVIFKVTDC